MSVSFLIEFTSCPIEFLLQPVLLFEKFSAENRAKQALSPRVEIAIDFK
jgi:hypothetical protein